MTPSRTNSNKELTPFLTDCGFTKKGSVWAIRKEEFLLCIEFQKSQWSETYYINTGIDFSHLDEKLPKPYKSHIQFRIVDQENTKDSFDLVLELPLIEKLLDEQVVKKFLVLSTVDEIKNEIEKDLSRYRVSVIEGSI